MQFSIRRLTRGHEAGIVAAGALFDRIPEPEATRRFLAEPSHHLLIAYGTGDAPLGFITGIEMTHPDKGTEMFVYELGVGVDHRRRGIGRALVEALAALAIERECRGMWVLADADNGAARQTYLRAGARAKSASHVFEWAFTGSFRDREATESARFDAAPTAGSVVRAVETHDVLPWAALRARLWPEADATELAREVRAFLDGDAAPALTAAFVVAAADDSAPAGFLELALRPFSDGCESMPVPHVEGWYVEPGARGRGFGRALMHAAEEWARTRGFRELASDTGVENEAAVRAHERCGFHEVDRLIKLRKSIGD